MASTQAARKTNEQGDAPTDAQLATISALCETLGVEPPEPQTADEATKIIETLQETMESPTEEPAPEGEPASGDEPAPGEPGDEPAPTPKDSGLSMEKAHAMFTSAVDALGDALKTLYEVDVLEPAQTPGVVGFVLPGYMEELPHADFTRCTTCNGYGDVLTGSTKAGNERRPCPDPRCKGLGYWTKAGAPEPVAPTLLPVQQVAANGSGEWAPAPTWLGDPNLTGVTAQG